MPPRRSRTFAAVNYGYGIPELKNLPPSYFTRFSKRGLAGKQALMRGRTRDPLHGGVAIATVVSAVASIVGPVVMNVLKSIASNLSTSIGELVKDPRKLLAAVTKFAPHLTKIVRKALEVLHIKKPKPATVDPGEMPTEPVSQPARQPVYYSDPGGFYNNYVKPAYDPYLQQIKQQIQQSQQWQQWQGMLHQMNNPQMKINPDANYSPNDEETTTQQQVNANYSLY